MKKTAIVLGCAILFSLTVNLFASAPDTTDDGTGIISARGENLPNEGAVKAFDNDPNTKWLDFNPSSSWIQYRYAAGKTAIVTEYTLTSADDSQERDPTNWNLLGSNDGGASWVTLDARTGELFTARYQKRTFQFTNSTAYNIYRLEITQLRGPAPNSVQLAELELLGYFDTTKAHNPSPSDNAENISPDTTLSWTAGDNASSHDVYFGTNSSDVNSANRLLGDLNGNGIVDWIDLARLTGYWLTDPTGTEPYAGIDDNNTVDFFDYALLAEDWKNSANPVFKGNQSSTSYNPGTLASNTTYYWRIDEVNGIDTVKGDLWSFTTQSNKAINPTPANSAADVDITTDLSWTAGAGATSHNVYFGTTNPPASQGNQAGTTFNTGTMTNSTVYYWRIDEVGGSGTVTGDLWNFTTVPLSTTLVYPYLTWLNDPTNSVVVNWWNPDATGNSSVDYGPTNSYGSTATAATVSNFHHVELTGLTAGATYHYRVRSSDGTVGSDNTYTVSAASPTSFKFAVLGDTQINYDPHRAQCDHIVTKNPSFVLHTGDLVQYGDSQSDWENFFKAEQNLSKSRVFMPTMGNHEVQPGGVPYYYFFDMYADGLAVPDNGMTAYGPRTYSFDYGNSHHIIICSYQISSTLERDWIAADLAVASANPNIKWIFAYMHKPLYTAGQWPADKAVLALWGPVFDQYHVDMVFAGHNHIYERSYSIKNNVIVSSGAGTIYTTCGLGAAPGGSWSSSSPDAPFIEKWFTPNKTGATYITINGGSLSAELIMVDNTVLDTFTLSK